MQVVSVIVLFDLVVNSVFVVHLIGLFLAADHVFTVDIALGFIVFFIIGHFVFIY